MWHARILLVAYLLTGIPIAASTPEKDQAPAFAGLTLYVDRNASGSTHDGTSWCDAYATLQEALVEVDALGSSDARIQIAGGTYTPTGPNGSRSASFTLRDGVTLAGGYAGCSGPLPDERDFNKHETLLSGDLNSDDVGDINDPSRDDNSYHVLTATGNDAFVTLDGISVAAGNADALPDAENRVGGGMSAVGVVLTIVDCTFRNNFARSDGGAINMVEGALIAERCTFTENAANWTPKQLPALSPDSASNSNAGGGIRTRRSEVRLTDCAFNANTSSSGAALRMYGDYSQNAVFLRCSFVGNATPAGAHTVAVDSASATLDGCTFRENNSGALTWVSTRGTLNNCDFKENDGSALFMWGTFNAIDASQCVFTANAGGIINDSYEYRVALVDCLFVGNDVMGSGGAISSPHDGTLDVERCTFLDNTAGQKGGAAWSIGSYSRCVFAGNSATTGGACYSNDFAPSFRDCVFVGNVASGDGGAVYAGKTAAIARSTISANTAGGIGGGVFFAEGGVVTSSIIWKNNDAMGTGEFSEVHPSADMLTVEFNSIEGWTPEGLGGFFNISTDPRFVDPLGADGIAGTIDDDLHLLPDSPCINTGSFTFCSPCCETDVDGGPRSLCGRHDMGAFESGIGDYDCDRDVDLDDYARWSDCLIFPDTLEFCEAFDADADCDVDLLDFGAFQVALGGQ